MNNQKGFISVAVAITIVVVVILFVGAGMYYQYQKNNEPHDIIGWDDIVEQGNISNFEECIAAGNPAMESHPRQCIDNGRTFVEDITNTNTLVDETDDWQTYTDSIYGFSFKYPSDWEVGDERLSNLILNPDGQTFKYEIPMVRVNYDYNKELRQTEHHGDVNLFFSDMSSDLFAKEYNNDGDIGSVQTGPDIVEVGGIEVYKVVVSTAIGLDRNYLFFSEGVKKPFFISYYAHENDQLSIINSLDIL